MNRNWLSTSCLLCAALVAALPSALPADETWYETQGGTTYRVTKRIERRPVAETRMEPQTQSVTTNEYVTEMRATARVQWVPVTQTVYEPRWTDWWNPFAPAQVAYQPRQVTRWQLRTEMVREPVTRRQQVPQERIVQKPVRALGFVDEQVEERIVVSTPLKNSPTTLDVQYAERPNAPSRNNEFPRLGQPVTTLGMPLRR